MARISPADIVGYPDGLVRSYRERGVWPDLTIGAAFRATAMRHPELPAVSSPDTVLSYRELDRRADRVAAGLLSAGLEPGDRVLMQVTNSARAVLAWYGLLKAGLVPVATLPHHRRHELDEIGAQAQPAAHLVDVRFAGQDLVELARDVAGRLPSPPKLLTIGSGAPDKGALALERLGETGDPAAARARVDAVQAALRPDEVAVLQLSGGTTAVPKLIPRLHGEYWYNACAYGAALDLGAGDCVLHLLPVVHNAGIVCGVHAAHAVGSCFATSGHAPDAALAVARRTPPTHMIMAAPIAQMVFAHPELRAAVGGLRRMVWTLGKLPLHVREAFETSDCTIQQLYGQGEGLCMVTPASAPAEIRHESVGRPISALDEVRVYAPGTEDPVPAGEPGELCCRGPYTVRGYFRAQRRNAEAFTADGFYRTGDIVVEVDGPGGPYYAMEDRLKDVINRGGEKINALEVENLLIRHPAVQAAALVAVPDGRLGERACAVLVVAEGSTPPDVASLREFLDGLGVAKFKWPERVHLREALPLTSVNKVNKALLRAEVAAGPGAEPPDAR